MSRPAVPHVTYKPPRCPTCQSTERGQLEGVRYLEYSGRDRDGNLYSRVCWAYTTCKCGQRYSVRWEENH